MNKAKNLFPDRRFFFIIIATFFLQASVANAADTLRVTVDKTNVSLDWSAMPAAPSYTLYYALADWKGAINADTIKSIEMGNKRSLYVSDLPSGLILHVAILAHTGGGDVPSNIVQLMPFAGTVTFPETGSELMAANDPGGLGKYTLYGTRDVSGTPDQLTQINYQGADYSFALKISGNRPVEITEGSDTIKIIHHADGSVTFQKIQSALSSIQVNQTGLLAGSAVANDLCANYATKDDYAGSLRDADNYTIDGEVDRRARELGYPHIGYLMYYINKHPKGFDTSDGRLAVLGRLVALAGSDRTRTKLLQNLKPIAGYLDLLCAAVEGIEDQVVDEKLAAYDQQCDQEGTIVEIDFDAECPIPAGAERVRNDYNDYARVYYTLNGHVVGPHESWSKSPTGGSYYLAGKYCQDLTGRLQGWRILYFKNGGMKFANHYKNHRLDGHSYKFFCNGSTAEDRVYENDTLISKSTYNLAGELCTYWDENRSDSNMCEHKDVLPSECE